MLISKLTTRLDFVRFDVLKPADLVYPLGKNR